MLNTTDSDTECAAQLLRLRQAVPSTLSMPHNGQRGQGTALAVVRHYGAGRDKNKKATPLVMAQVKSVGNPGFPPGFSHDSVYTGMQD